MENGILFVQYYPRNFANEWIVIGFYHQADAQEFIDEADDNPNASAYILTYDEAQELTNGFGYHIDFRR